MKTSKSKIRDEMLNRRAQMHYGEIINLSGSIAKRVIGLDFFKRAAKVGLYIALNNEVDTKRIIDKVRSLGNEVYVPKYFSKDKKYRFGKFTGWQDLESGPYGTFQPKGRSAVNSEEIDLCFLPGVAFDVKGTRVGYGKGVYDRLLADCRAPKIGLCYDFQLKDLIEADRHDVEVDMIVTEKRSIGC